MLPLSPTYSAFRGRDAASMWGTMKFRVCSAGWGSNILTTPKGVMTGRQARKQRAWAARFFAKCGSSREARTALGHWILA